MYFRLNGSFNASLCWAFTFRIAFNWDFFLIAWQAFWWKIDLTVYVKSFNIMAVYKQKLSVSTELHRSRKKVIVLKREPLLMKKKLQWARKKECNEHEKKPYRFLCCFPFVLVSRNLHENSIPFFHQSPWIVFLFFILAVSLLFTSAFTFFTFPSIF